MTATNKCDLPRDATSVDLLETLRECARSLGIEILGVTSASPFPRAEAIARQRLKDGLMGELKWYTEHRIFRGTRPNELLDGAKSILSVAFNYLPRAEMSEKLPLNHGRIARYARGIDYHKVMKERLRQMMDCFSVRLGKKLRFKVYVDDGPMLDREVARRSGIGFYGKNTNILTKIGSWVFLGQVIVDLDLPVTRASGKSCGSCSDCIPACPTGAIIAPYVIDSNRCISYLTIEHRGSIPKELRPMIGDMLFGCDLCQEVCPVNKKLGEPTTHSEFYSSEGAVGMDLSEILFMDEDSFQRRFRNSPVRRATRIGLQRNACIVLGNSKDKRVVPLLSHALVKGESLVREHAAWALGQIKGQAALLALKSAWISESDSAVLEEISNALQAPVNSSQTAKTGSMGKNHPEPQKPLRPLS